MSGARRLAILALGVWLVATGSARAGLLVACGETIGYPPNNFTLEATNIVNYTFNSGQTATNDFAIFQTHDPWGGTVVKDAITGAGHTFSVFTPAQLAGFTFTDYRVVVLNWDDSFITDFNADYSAAIPALQAYVNAGGVLWVQASIQGTTGDSFMLPDGGTADWNLADTNSIVDCTSPMMTGLSNPVVGGFASHMSITTPPPAANIVKRAFDAAGPVTLYDSSVVPVE